MYCLQICPFLSCRPPLTSAVPLLSPLGSLLAHTPVAPTYSVPPPSDVTLQPACSLAGRLCPVGNRGAHLGALVSGGREFVSDFHEARRN